MNTVPLFFFSRNKKFSKTKKKGFKKKSQVQILSLDNNKFFKEVYSLSRTTIKGNINERATIIVTSFPFLSIRCNRPINENIPIILRTNKTMTEVTRFFSSGSCSFVFFSSDLARRVCLQSIQKGILNFRKLFLARVQLGDSGSRAAS